MIVTELRWSFEEVDKAPWSYVSDLIKYWNKTPPLSRLHNLVSRALGFKMVDTYQTTEFEKQLEAKAGKHSIRHVPSHLQDLLSEVREGKYKKHGRRADSN